MIIAYYLGLGLLCAAFLAGAAEVTVRVQPGPHDMLISAYDLWRVISPKTFTYVHIVIERDMSPWVWDSVLMMVLALPAWLIFGLPGGALTWLGLSSRQAEGDGEIDMDTFTLIDALSKRAKEEGYYDHEMDRNLDHSLDDDPVFADHDMSTGPHSNKVEHEDSLYMYDKLEKAAKEGYYDEQEDDARETEPHKNDGTQTKNGSSSIS